MYKKIIKVVVVAMVLAGIALQALKIKEYQTLLVNSRKVEQNYAECRTEYVKLYFYMMDMATELQRCQAH